MLSNMLNYIKDLFIGLFSGFLALFNDVFLFIFDAVMGAILLVLEGLSELMQFMDFTEYYDKLPSELVQGASALGLGQVFAIILSAHAIKLILQLIPLVRLGSK
ncbi:hypothetical protein VSVS12_02734 [Vibrio scophthalmi]|uniref:DUF2523 family protein n=1 Tax=Vibrio scophthalmi TaxID=45658 RepID=UPI0008093D4B|nr:DUF2523 family protein [Vibrio scophthalmi]ANS86483.1 hypothetical protein VSVS12_02734 [Vibrio scophthalmi]